MLIQRSYLKHYEAEWRKGNNVKALWKILFTSKYLDERGTIIGGFIGALIYSYTTEAPFSWATALRVLIVTLCVYVLVNVSSHLAQGFKKTKNRGFKR